MPNSSSVKSQPDSRVLGRIANQLRIESIRATSAAGSGHPTSCCSAADLVAAVFFGEMRYLPEDPRFVGNDRFVLSKGHAAPLLYAAWAETGHFPVEELLTLRKLDSPFEGHPTPQLDFVDVATGSLGQGLAAGLGMAWNARIESLDSRIFVLMGDGEMAEGSVWEAASLAGVKRLSNLVAMVDVNRLGQSQATAFGHHVEVYRKRFEAFGWRAIAIDGHDMDQISAVLATAGESEFPLAVIARTIKGKGIPEIEDAPGWHGKPLPEELENRAIAHLRPNAQSAASLITSGALKIPLPDAVVRAQVPMAHKTLTKYDRSAKVATRKAFGNALARLGGADPRIVVLDGDVENSTYTDSFSKENPERFLECYIAEQTIVGAASGLAALGRIPIASTFAAFFARAFDQIRMAGGLSQLNIKLVGTHCGVSIGEDGPSQMGLEDMAMMRTIPEGVVLCPSDAISTERLVERMVEHPGFCYMRTARPATPILYSVEEVEKFKIGGAHVLRQGKADRVTVVATGVTVFEALSAADALAREGISIAVIDAYSIKPLARELILACARRSDDRVITVEDHYVEGGLGDAVAGELSVEGIRVRKLGVRELPHSGTEKELLAKYGIDAQAIVLAAREELAGVRVRDRAA
jgi:transketolase